jgi:nucleoside-diphosphate-sugar epimerase
MDDFIIGPEETILVTGAAGFIGIRLVSTLQRLGFRKVRCLVRPSCDPSRFANIPGLELVNGNLLSREDCEKATRDVAVIYHLAAGTGSKSFADTFMNSVVTTRNLLEGARQDGRLRRFVNISSFAVYTNANKRQRGVLDESCPIEAHPETRGDAYAYAKAKQDELVMEYAGKYGIRHVMVRPGVVYGPGKARIHGRVGLDTFGIFLHLGGANPVPLTYVDNCAELIATAGLIPGIEGEIFNAVDDDLPSSSEFLRLYKKEVRRFPSLYLPHFASYLLCLLWEKLAHASGGQLPPIHNRKEWMACWKRTQYSNEKAKRMLKWSPRVSTTEGLQRYFDFCKGALLHA